MWIAENFEYVKILGILKWGMAQNQLWTTSIELKVNVF